MGLLVKQFHRDRLEIVASPHADDIKLHMQSGWDTPFIRKSLLAFSMHFLHTGDLVRIIAGEICSKIGTVISMDHASGSMRLETNFDSHRREIDVRLEDVECIFRVGDEIRVVAGPYLGLEGHIIQISDDMFHICQAVSKEEVAFTHKLQSYDSLTHFIGTCFEILLGSSPLASCLSPAATHAAAL
jgi:ribosomal protein L24